MIAAPVAQLTLDVVTPAVVITGRRCRARVRATGLNRRGSRKSNNADRRGPVSGRTVAKLAKCVASPAEHQAGGCSPARVYGARSDCCEYAGRFNEAWLRPITWAGGKLSEVVSSPTVDFAHSRNSAGVLVARGHADETLRSYDSGRRSSIVARSVAELA